MIMFMTAFRKGLFLVLACLFSVELVASSEYIKPPQPILSVDSFILIDANTGIVLAEKNSTARIEPASLAKIMTTYVVAKALQAGHVNLNDIVIVSEKAWRMEGSRMFIEVGKEVSIDALLDGMIIQSGNDASVALAEHIYGSEAAFVNQMNTFAKKLGLEDTSFGNVSGLPDSKTFTTAKDIVILSKKLIQEFPEIYSRFSEKTFTFNNITQRNRNVLLHKSRFVDGIKTGFTESARYCLVSSGNNGSIRLIAAVIGAKTNKARFRDTKALLDYGFRFFESRLLFESLYSIEEARVWGGESDMIKTGLTKDVFLLSHMGRSDEVMFEVVYNEKLTAPIKRGQPVGLIVIQNFMGEKNNYELVALESVEQGSVFKRLLDKVRMQFENNE